MEERKPWMSWPKVPGWLDLRHMNGNTPIAPISSQQAAGKLELSVQEMMGELGGYKIVDLQEAVASKWAFKFKISKIWRASDSLRETGVYRYLEHHWLIIKLEPADSSNAGQQADRAVSAATLPDQEGYSSGDASLIRKDSESGLGQKRNAESVEPGSFQRPCSKAAYESAEGPAKKGPERDAIIDISRGQESGVLTDSSLEAACKKQPGNMEDDVILVSQEAMMQPLEDSGLELADAGVSWYLRIDRFDEADKWFACRSFENALLTEQARERHYRPSSSLVFKVEPEGHPLFLDCLVPSLVRLADVEYSVFAKGTHCQWHAKVVTCLAASVGHFLDPHSISEEYRTTVSPILLNAREQSKYSDVAGKLAEPSGEAVGFVRRRPEAPFLKPCLRDLKQLAAQKPARFQRDCNWPQFPDLNFIYTDMHRAEESLTVQG